MTPSVRDPDVLVDSKLGDTSYVDSFGFEWTYIDGFVGKEVMSHGHVFGRFMLPRDFFAGKQVVDVGCGNGRIGRLIAPLSRSYIGIDLSEAVFAFPRYIKKPGEFRLVRASGTDLPLVDGLADVSICWGVVHHMDNPDAAVSELFRITKPGGTILIFVYPKQFDGRKNLNTYIRGLPQDRAHGIIDTLSDGLDAWREVDAFYAGQLGNHMAMSVKHSKEWQKFQWFDGITPRYHWSLEDRIPQLAQSLGARRILSYRPGCFVIEK
jgi:SAM-dependent methyltransferase